MTTIHMDTEQVRDLARRCGYIASEAHGSIHTLRSAHSRLNWAWQGDVANQFRADFLRTIHALEQQADELRALGFRVDREVDEWQRADMNGMNSFQGVCAVPDFIGGGNSGFSKPSEEFDWLKSFNSIFENSSEHIFKYYKQIMTFEGYRNFGRMINRWLGKPHGGWVGRMDKLGHFIESDIVGDVIFPTGISTISGMIDGETLPHAVISGGIETGLTYFIPGVDTVLAVTGGIQIAGSALAMGLEASGQHKLATLLQNSIESVDLGGYVGDFADAVTDVISPPYNHLPDFSEITKRASKIINLGKRFFG